VRLLAEEERLRRQSVVEDEVFQQSILDRLDRLDRSLANIAAMLCPICREEIMAAEHPAGENGKVKRPQQIRE